MRPKHFTKSGCGSDRSISLLHRLARQHGVVTSYVDMGDCRQIASPESLLGVLRTLGVPVASLADVPEALRQTCRAMAHRVLEPVHVAWQGKSASIPFQLPDGAAGSLAWELRLEDGELRRGEHRIERLAVRRVSHADGGRYVTRLIPVPRRLPVGYHRLTIHHGHEGFATELFCAPELCYQGDAGRRVWGMFAPLYALHSDRGWGVGDIGDLEDFVQWVGNEGGGFVGTLPLLSAFLKRPCEPSPYSPVSRLMWNELYLDLECVPELQSSVAARRLLRSGAFKQRRQKLRRDPLVNYPAQMALKRQILEILSRAFFANDSVRRRTFEEFLVEEPRVADYARFRAMQEQRNEPWTEWPARMRRGDLRDADCGPVPRQYHLYVQWLAHQQMTQLSRHALEQRVDLYLDMPLGTHREGYDAWRYQQLFALEASGGAPPDPVFTQGQDWGFAPVHPERSRNQGHEYIRAYLRHHLRHARMLRFDHVMGLHRLYWVPRGWPAKLGAYVKYPSEEYYAMLSIESHRYQASIIGENLGTVPAAVNRSLERHGIAGMFVVQYEARPAPRPALRPVPARVVASLNTHDMPPFAAFWKGLDIDDRRKLGLIVRSDLGRERKLRALTCQSLLRLPGVGGKRARGETAVVDVWRGIVKVLGASAARWVLLNLEDLWAETVPQNTPGTSTERVNWRRKVRLSMEALSCDEGVLQSVRELARVRPSQRFAEITLGVRPIDGFRQGRQDGVAGAGDPFAGRSRKP